MARIALVLASLAAGSTRADMAPLPDLDTVLTKATSKAHDFAEQAAAMQQRLREQQEKSRAALAAEKRDFERRLDHMQEQSENVSIRNSELLAGNRALERENSALLAEVTGIQEKNGQMRATLQSLNEKIAAAQLFLVDSLKVTDDSEADDLKVLVPTTPKPTLLHFLDVTTGRKLSLLAIGSKLRDYPSELVSGLSTSLSEIKDAEDEGAAELRKQFMASMAEQQERQAQLNATQAELLQTKAALEERHGKLVDAKAHLQATSKQLQDRLNGLRVFADRVNVSAGSALGVKDVRASNASASDIPRPSQNNTVQMAAADQSNVTAAQTTRAVVNQTIDAAAANTSLTDALNTSSLANKTVVARRMPIEANDSLAIAPVSSDFSSSEFVRTVLNQSVAFIREAAAANASLAAAVSANLADNTTVAAVHKPLANKTSKGIKPAVVAARKASTANASRTAAAPRASAVANTGGTVANKRVAAFRKASTLANTGSKVANKSVAAVHKAPAAAAKVPQVAKRAVPKKAVPKQAAPTKAAIRKAATAAQAEPKLRAKQSAAAHASGSGTWASWLARLR